MDEGSEPGERQAVPTRGGDGKFTRTPEGAERDAAAAKLRGNGLSYRAIASQLNMDVSSAHAAVQRALREIVEEPAEDVRRIELERLDTMYEAAMGVLERQHVTVSNGRVVCLDDEPLPDDGPVLHAIDRLLRIAERRAKLLGLDSAQKVDVSGGVRYEIVGVDPEALK
jgi:hypothetical protein